MIVPPFIGVGAAVVQPPSGAAQLSMGPVVPSGFTQPHHCV